MGDVQREGILLGSQAEGHELQTAQSGTWRGVSWLYHTMATKSRKGRSTCVGKEQGFDEGPGQTALLGPLLLGLVHSSEIVHS